MYEDISKKQRGQSGPTSPLYPGEDHKYQGESPPLR